MKIKNIVNRCFLETKLLQYAFMYATTHDKGFRKRMRQYEFVKKFKNHKITLNNG